MTRTGSPPTGLATASAHTHPASDHQPGLVKELLSAVYGSALTAFLSSGARLRFPVHATPQVSVLLILFNRAELTLRCLRTLLEHTDCALEILIVDNDSSDHTCELLDRIDGATIIRSTENLGFLRACNLAAAHARGTYLLFLNNDAELLPDSIRKAVDVIEDPDVGAVGGKLILPSGELQEAGSIIWRDGSCLGYGRGDSPSAPQYAFQRDVDYCSAALLLVKRDLFTSLDGFDERFAPAYYEDCDLCVRLWKAGARVVYHPAVAAQHFEFASSVNAVAAVTMQLDRRARFVAKHADWLATQFPPSPKSALQARERLAGRRRILVIDDRVPHATAGFGFPRAVDFLRTLVDLGYAVTMYPTSVESESWAEAYKDVPQSIELMVGWGPDRVRQFFEERRGFFEAIVVSRPHNMEMLRAKLGSPETWSPPARVIYDAEAVATLRDIARRRLSGERITNTEIERLTSTEVALAAGTSAILCVSEREGHCFSTRGFSNVHEVSFSIPCAPTSRSFDDRVGILFVGAFHELSPNADSVLWFAREVLPRVQLLTELPVVFTVVGQNPPEEVMALDGTDIHVCPGVEDLTPLYDAARLFVAPTRYAAGIPFKVVHAAAHGVPVVTTRLLAEQLKWRDGTELLSADDAETFAAACARAYMDRHVWRNLRDGALARIASDFAPGKFRDSLAIALQSAAPRDAFDVMSTRPHD